MVHSFDTFEVDTAGRELRLQGRPVDIEPKVFELLLYLIEHRDRVVPKSELFDALWPDVVVAPAALTSCVTRLRRALDETEGDAEIIRTFHRHGYRFVANLHGDAEIRVAEIPATPAAALGRAPISEGASEYVGREPELAELRTAIEQLTAGTGPRSSQALLLRGDAGVGKSRTLEEAAGYAVGRGAEVLVARCYEGEGAGGFWPWVRILRACAEPRQSRDFAALAAHGAAELARAVPSLREILPGPAALPLPDGDEARAPFFDAVATLLSNAAAERPLVLVFDDLHWADTASLLLLRFVIHERPTAALLVLGAFRPLEAEASHPLVTLLAALQREARCRLVSLGPLPEIDAYAMLRNVAGADVEAALAASIIETTEGNPLFIGEYWRALVEHGVVQLDEGDWRRSEASALIRVPESIRALIGRRLQGLSESCADHLRLAAVAGREFSFDLLQRAAGAPRDALLDSLDEAIAAHVIGDDPNVIGRYRFTHALLRETLYESLSAMRRAQCHERIGAALLDLGAADSEEGQPDVAYHLIQAAPAGNAEAAIEHAQRAAVRSTQLLAYEDAATWLERALEVFDQPTTPPQLRSKQPQVALALADALERAGESNRARDLFLSVATAARSRGDAEVLARAALGLTTRWTFYEPQLIALLEEALALTAEGELRTRLLGRLAVALYPADASEPRRIALCREAVESAHRSGDAHVIGHALADSLSSLWHVSNVREQLAMAEELAQVGPRTGDPRLTLTAAIWRLCALLGLGRIPEADTELAQLAAAALAARLPTFLWTTKYLEGNLHLVHGRLPQAEEAIETAFVLGQRVSESGAAYAYRGQIFALRREQGRAHELEAAITAAVIDPGNLDVARWSIPYFFSEIGRYEQARTTFEAAVARDFADVPPENARNTRLSALGCHAEVCGYLDAGEYAQPLYALLEPYYGQWAVLGWGVLTNGPVDQSLAVLAGVLRHWEEAEQRFKRVIEDTQRQGAVLQHIRALHNYARMLLLRDRQSDRARARDLVDRAQNACRRFAVRGFEERLAVLAESAKGKRLKGRR